MRENLPVTQSEREFPADATLMSTTDTQSRIDYANAAFVAISGFKRDELVGQPHNLVRHPDMPREAFADMWATLKAGMSWTALVKNRCKDGAYYWVRANATPINRAGQIAGFMSVRTKPTRSEIEAAEVLYREFREGRAGRRRFHQGLIVRTGLLAWTSWLQVMPVRWRLRSGVLGLTAALLGCSSAAGLAGTALAAFCGVAVACAVIASAFLEAQISRPLERVLRQALSVAAGQPGESVNLNRVDEIGMILRALNQSGLNLRSLVDDVSEQVDGVRTASSEIAMGNNDLSARTEQAASNLEETAASMAQMNVTVKNNVGIAQQAALLARDAAEGAAAGGSAVGQVVGTMNHIRTSSKSMAGIIGKINDIAFRINILALNAAVEAAHAGDRGRGFAIVAAEVRGLAQSTAAAATEIKALIDASVGTVESGALQVEQASQAIGNIVEQARRVNVLMDEISSVTVQQSGGIGEVNTALTQLDQMTQQNAALVEQSAAAAESLQGQAVRLAESVGVFAN